MIGQRVRFVRDVERFPQFIVRAGEDGTVVVAMEGFVAVRLDQPHPGASAWDNEIHFYGDAAMDLLRVARFIQPEEHHG